MVLFCEQNSVWGINDLDWNKGQRYCCSVRTLQLGKSYKLELRMTAETYVFLKLLRIFRTILHSFMIIAIGNWYVIIWQNLHKQMSFACDFWNSILKNFFWIDVNFNLTTVLPQFSIKTDICSSSPRNK